MSVATFPKMSVEKKSVLTKALMESLIYSNFKATTDLLDKYNADPNFIDETCGLAPIHYACVIEDENLSVKLTKSMLDHGGNPNAKAFCGETPLHLAASLGHFAVAEMLLKHGADLGACDKDGDTPIVCAVSANNFKIVQLFQYHLKCKKVELQKQLLQTKLPCDTSMTLKPRLSISTNTPVSPYYINGTFRKRDSNPVHKETSDGLGKENFFDITQQNLKVYSEMMKKTISNKRISVIDRLKSKQPLRERLSLDKLDEILKEFDAPKAGKVPNLPIASAQSSSIKIDKTPKVQKTVPSEKSYSPQLLHNGHLTETYKYSDLVNKLTLYEMIIIPNVSTKTSFFAGENPAASKSLSQMKKELVSKKVRHYIVMKRKTRIYYKDHGDNLKFPIELEQLLHPKSKWKKLLASHAKLETTMMEQLANKWSKITHPDGNSKTSFVFILLDPRKTENLPGCTAILSELEVWQQFIESVFHVGTATAERPFAALYPALRSFNVESSKKDTDMVRELASIWRSAKGVVCLQVFHQITPAEASIRKATIIDAIDIKNLTNQKPGDYYGPTLTWSLRDKRQLGASLLYKAMKQYLSEGEKQLLPKL